MPDNRETLQVNQPNIITPPETNWPDPLVDPSSKLKMVVTNGSNGSQKNFDPTSTSMQNQLSKPEGSGGPTSSPNTATDNGGGSGSFTQTSQQKRGELQLSGEDKVGIK